MKLVYEFKVTMQVLADRLSGVFGVTHPPEVYEDEKARVEKLLTQLMLERIGGAEKFHGFLISSMGVIPIDSRVEAENKEGAGLSRLISEAKENKGQPTRSDLIQAICELADGRMKCRPKVEVERRWVSGAQPLSPGVWCWVVRVDSGAVRIEVQHPDYRVATGMAAAALNTEGM